MNDNGTILAVDVAELAAGPPFDLGLKDVHLELAAGQMACVHVAAHEANTPLADLVMGMLTPDKGVVRFKDTAWASMSASDTLAARATIGRVFSAGAWVSNLDMDENILLRCRHHRSDIDDQVSIRVRALAERFSVSDIFGQRPAWVSRSAGKRAQWVRALAGRPALLVLEQPLHDVEDRFKEAFLETLEEVRADGTAVLWVGPQTQGITMGMPIDRFQVLNERWIPESIDARP
ncbi:MAG: ABC-type ATPase involved in cell division [Candidatus Promineifilaceae bacterium]|jgi:ABC-type ATPase involved in cell division